MLDASHARFNAQCKAGSALSSAPARSRWQCWVTSSQPPAAGGGPGSGRHWPARGGAVHRAAVGRLRHQQLARFVARGCAAGGFTLPRPAPRRPRPRGTGRALQQRGDVLAPCGARGCAASLKTRCSASFSRPGCAGRPARCQSRKRAAAVPGAGGEAQHLVGHAGHVERTREHVDQQRDRLGMLAHRARAVDQEGHHAVGLRLDAVRCGTGAARSARRSAATAARPSMRPSSCAPAQPSRLGRASTAFSWRARRAG
jgi:hypothetical protein